MDREEGRRVVGMGLGMNIGHVSDFEKRESYL